MPNLFRHLLTDMTLKQVQGDWVIEQSQANLILASLIQAINKEKKS